MTGLLNVLKTPGMTSHDVVARLRRLTKMKRIGHAGTLDPQAAGVLPVCAGVSTKMIPFMDHRLKTYRVEMKVGIKTDTQDTTGVVLHETKNIPTPAIIQKTLMGMIGEYWQTPPMYSAIKYKGKKLYQLAREGIEIERAPRKKVIYDIRWIAGDLDRVFFDVDCSEGTYVRTLCDDVGNLLGCGAAMSFLLRTESCRLRINEAVTLKELEEIKTWTDVLLPVDIALRHHPKTVVSNLCHRKILNGVAVDKFQFEDAEKSIFDQEDHRSEIITTRVYLEKRFIGMGGITVENGELSMTKLLPQLCNGLTD